MTAIAMRTTVAERVASASLDGIANVTATTLRDIVTRETHLVHHDAILRTKMVETVQRSSVNLEPDLTCVDIWQRKR